LRQVERLAVGVDALPAVLPDEGSQRQKTNRILANDKYSGALSALLLVPGLEHRWLGGGVPCATLADQSGVFAVPLFELEKDAASDDDDDIFEVLAVKPMSRALLKVGGPSDLPSRWGDNGDSPSKATRQQSTQTLETASTMDDLERDLKDQLRRDTQATLAAAEAEKKSLMQSCARLESEAARRVAELRDAEQRHRERETLLLGDIDRLKRDVYERTAFIMKLRKITNPAAALLLTEDRAAAAGGGGRDSSGAGNSMVQSAIVSGSHHIGASVPNQAIHSTTAIGASTQGAGQSASAVAPPSTSGSSPIESNSYQLPLDSPSDGTTYGNTQAAKEALLRVRQSIADGERFIESMRKRAAESSSSPPLRSVVGAASATDEGPVLVGRMVSSGFNGEVHAQSSNGLWGSKTRGATFY
jgi:hypothetical protein